MLSIHCTSELSSCDGVSIITSSSFTEQTTFSNAYGEFSLLSHPRDRNDSNLSRLTNRSGATSMIREQDLNSSPSSVPPWEQQLNTISLLPLSSLDFTFPQALCAPSSPPLATINPPNTSISGASNVPGIQPNSTTSSSALISLSLLPTVSWPLDLFFAPL